MKIPKIAAHVSHLVATATEAFFEKIMWEIACENHLFDSINSRHEKFNILKM